RLAPALLRILRSPSGAIGGILLALLIAAAFGASWATPYDPTAQDLGATTPPPSLTPVPGNIPPLGTHQLGRHILRRPPVGPQLSPGGARRRPPLHVPGHGGGDGDGVPGRMDRPRVDARGGRPARDPHPASDGRRGGRAGLRSCADRNRPGDHRLDDLRAGGARRGAVPPRAGLRGRGAGDGGVRPAPSRWKPDAQP